MGALHYGSTQFEIDDEALRHFVAVMVTKLRRKEPFLALVRSDADGLERVWVHTASTIRVETEPSTQSLDQARLQHMMSQSHKGGVDLCAPWKVAVAA